MGIQVSLLTQNKQPYEKEFIDFQFDGRYISEFGLVAVVDGDRLLFDGTPSFQDEVTSVKGVTGQYYWGTNIGAKTRTFTLATDGMTEQQVLEFQHHFQPGRYGKFIEDTFAYRYSYCRVSAPPQFKMIPFKQKASMANSSDSSIQYESFINLYKGEISITLTWDYPYSFSEKNYLELDTTKNINEQLRAIFTNMLPSTLSWKIQDPASARMGMGRLQYLVLGRGSVIDKCYLGAEKRLTGNGFEDDDGFGAAQGDISLKGKMMLYNPSVSSSPANISIENLQLQYTPVNWEYVAAGIGTEKQNDQESGTVHQDPSKWEKVYFNNIVDNYNKKAVRVLRTKIKDGEQQVGETELVPLDKDNGYIIPYNTIQVSSRLYPYSYLKEQNGIETVDISEFEKAIIEDDLSGKFTNRFHYTTPNVIASIHQSIDIAYKFGQDTNGNTNRVELEEELRKNIHHDAVLNWAIAAVRFLFKRNDNSLKDTIWNSYNWWIVNYANFYEYNIDKSYSLDIVDGVANARISWMPYFNLLMLCFFRGLVTGEKDSISLSSEEATKWGMTRKISLFFNGQDSQSLIRYTYNYLDPNDQKIKSLNREEGCGDAILSGYLKIEGGNTLDQNGNIKSCYCLGFKQGGYDYAVPRTKIRYQYIYL